MVCLRVIGVSFRNGIIISIVIIIGYLLNKSSYLMYFVCSSSSFRQLHNHRYHEMRVLWVKAVLWSGERSLAQCYCLVVIGSSGDAGCTWMY